MSKILFDGEEVLKTWMNCTLTNKRVWQQRELGGSFQYKGFPISKFQGASIGKISYPWLMYIGVGFCALSIFTFLGNSEDKFATFFGVFLIGAISLGLWHFLKRAQVSFASSEVNIEVDLHANEEAFKAALSFVSEIEKAATTEKKHSASVAA